MAIFNSKLLVITRGYPLLYGHVYRENLQVPGHRCHRRLEAAERNLADSRWQTIAAIAIPVSIDPKTASNNDMSIIYNKI